MQKLANSRDRTQEEEEGIVVPHVLARLRFYNKSPEAGSRARMAELWEPGSSRTAEEQSELDRLTALYPGPPLDPSHPRYRELERERLINGQEAELDRMRSETLQAETELIMKTMRANLRERALHDAEIARRFNKPRDDAAEQPQTNGDSGTAIGRGQLGAGPTRV